MGKQRKSAKNEQLRALLQKGGRMGAKNDFSELLRRAISPKKA